MGVSHTDIGFLPVGRLRPLTFNSFSLLPSLKLYSTRTLILAPFSSTHNHSTHPTSAHEAVANLGVSPLDSKLKSPPRVASVTSFSLGLASVSTACSGDIDVSTFITPLPVGHSADTADIPHRSFSSGSRKIFDRASRQTGHMPRLPSGRSDIWPHDSGTGSSSIFILFCSFFTFS